MKSDSKYKIEFAGLKIGSHQFNFIADKKFFDRFNFSDFNDVSVNIDIDLTKKSTLLELDFVLAGGVNLNCDLTNEPFDFQIKHKSSLVVKFGQDYNDEDDEILVLPHGEHKLYVDQYIFELIVLSLPPKRIHPGVEDGTLKSEILDILEDLKPKENSNFADPRWEQLKSLKK
ncbi:MAG: DNA-binding protein [Paracoccaceae bacterium]|nr:MAG: DNA-binding protein [Paracoccaceae bacterium]